MHCLDPLNLSTTKGNAPLGPGSIQEPGFDSTGGNTPPGPPGYTLEALILQRLYPLPSYTGRLVKLCLISTSGSFGGSVASPRLMAASTSEYTIS